MTSTVAMISWKHNLVIAGLGIVRLPDYFLLSFYPLATWQKWSPYLINNANPSEASHPSFPLLLAGETFLVPRPRRIRVANRAMGTRMRIHEKNPLQGNLKVKCDLDVEYMKKRSPIELPRK